MMRCRADVKCRTVCFTLKLFRIKTFYKCCVLTSHACYKSDTNKHQNPVKIKSQNSL